MFYRVITFNNQYVKKIDEAPHLVEELLLVDGWYR